MRENSLSHRRQCECGIVWIHTLMSIDIAVAAPGIFHKNQRIWCAQCGYQRRHLQSIDEIINAIVWLWAECLFIHTFAFGINAAMGRVQVVTHRFRQFVRLKWYVRSADDASGQFQQRRWMQRYFLNETHNQRIFSQRELKSKSNAVMKAVRRVVWLQFAFSSVTHFD